tara:strand:- start:398 stop:1750 length:1353 start_codon:yes stop_codon:yes gene_type:complete
MAIKDTQDFLKKMRSFIDREYKRGALDKFPTIVTLTSKGFQQGFKEGYQDLLLKDPSLPILTDEEFLKAGQAALKAVAEWANQPRTRGTIVEEEKNRVVYRSSRDIKSVYTLAKKKGVEYIQALLKESGHRKLRGRDKQNNISARASEVGILKSATHRAHQGVTTVGAAQISGALRFLEKTRSFGGFAASKEASELSDIISNITTTFKTSGTKSGSKSSEVSVQEDIEIGIEMLPRSKNPAGVEDYDLNKLLPKLEKAVTEYIKRQHIENMPGSSSISQNAEELVTYMLLKQLSKSPNVGVTTFLLEPKGRKAKDVKKAGQYRKGRTQGSIKKARALKKKKITPAMKPLHLIGLINKELPNKVRENMEVPGLENRTGRFAQSARITDITETAKGFPSIGYTYQRDPYQVFENGSSGPWANGERDPRTLIDRSIREIAVQFAIGRFYTRRT